MRNRSAVLGGGGTNMYQRLLHDSTENLLRPTAQMIGLAQKKNSAALSNSFYSGANQYSSVRKSVGRKLASANMYSR